jgi:hypothetical protein
MWAAILSAVSGIWIMIAPTLLGFERTEAVNSYIMGPLITTFAITAIWEVNRSARYFNVFAGLWLVASPFLLEFETIACWNTVGFGLAITGLSFIKGTVRGKYGGGWRSLFQKSPLHIKQAEVEIDRQKN